MAIKWFSSLYTWNVINMSCNAHECVTPLQCPPWVIIWCVLQWPSSKSARVYRSAITTPVVPHFTLSSELLVINMLRPLVGCATLSGWWFGTFFIFPYIGNNNPIWPIVFRGVETTNQLWFCQLLIISLQSITVGHSRRLPSCWALAAVLRSHLDHGFMSEL